MAGGDGEPERFVAAFDDLTPEERLAYLRTWFDTSFPALTLSTSRSGSSQTASFKKVVGDLCVGRLPAREGLAVARDMVTQMLNEYGEMIQVRTQGGFRQAEVEPFEQLLGIPVFDRTHGRPNADDFITAIVQYGPGFCDPDFATLLRPRLMNRPTGEREEERPPPEIPRVEVRAPPPRVEVRANDLEDASIRSTLANLPHEIGQAVKESIAPEIDRLVISLQRPVSAAPAPAPSPSSATQEVLPSTEPVGPGPELAPSGNLYSADRVPQLLTEKYRPVTLAEIRGNAPIIAQLTVLARSPSGLPACMVFTGPPGIGKTSAAQAFARDYLRNQFARHGQQELVPERGRLPLEMYFEASAASMKDDPTTFITNRVLPFIRSAGFFGGSVKRFFVLDDVSKLSPENQKLLLRPLEQFSRGVTVIWISNEPEKRLPAIESRCAGFTYAFRPLSTSTVAAQLELIARNEGWTEPELAPEIARAAEASGGDLRAGINYLYAAHVRSQGGA